MELRKVIFVIVISSIFQGTIVCDSRENRLFQSLFKAYNKYLTPPGDEFYNVTEVELGLKLIQVVRLNSRQGEFESIIRTPMIWNDPRLSWNSKDPNWYNISVLNVPSSLVWTPKILLLSNSDESSKFPHDRNVLIYSNGRVHWAPQMEAKTSCTIDVTYYPFDQQTCVLIFSSLIYTGGEVILSYYKDMKQARDGYEMGYADLTRYTKTDNWYIIEVPAHAAVYNNTNLRRWDEQDLSVHNQSQGTVNATHEIIERISSITYYITLRRRVNGQIVGIILLTILLTYISIISLALPIDFLEIVVKVSGITSVWLFGLLFHVHSTLQLTSYATPLIIKFLWFGIFFSMASHVFSIILLNLKSGSGRVPLWTEKYIMGFLKKLRLIRNSVTEKSRSSIETSEPSVPENTPATNMLQWRKLTAALANFALGAFLICVTIGFPVILLRPSYLFEHVDEDKIIAYYNYGSCN